VVIVYLFGVCGKITGLGGKGVGWKGYDKDKGSDGWEREIGWIGLAGWI
jgi:hypothetical protein